ncbi:hypothetical protein ACFSC3_00205 [Sphingomonas floccifaciens]|uniref:Glycosyltransferase n=1 Tax=Sphingomonas floccifaciens TaxID=1844115 RepID=A0ABW4N7Y9_9SPHN
MGSVKIVNVPDISPGDPFVDVHSVDDRSVTWQRFSGLPRNAIERAVRRPRLSRYRAAWSAVGAARSADVIISHLPRMTAAVEDMRALRKPDCVHLAFSFNFTDLPAGRDVARMRRAFSGVDQFCVYSEYEATTYPQLFGVDPARFERVLWTQETPRTDTTLDLPFDRFVVAIGGEGRDYAGMLAAARSDPSTNWIVVARPSTLFDDAPSNMKVFFNLPPELTWGIAARAAAVIVPLKSDRTCCGHITIVSAQLLGLPVVSTRSMATTEYTVGIPGSTLIEPGAPDALAAAAAASVADAPRNRQLAESFVAEAKERYDRKHWAEYLRRFLQTRIPA